MGMSLAIITGLILDFILGDPQGWPHPIRFIGMLISHTEKVYRKIFKKTPKWEIVGGIFLTCTVTIIATVIPAVILYGAKKSSPFLYYIVASIMCYYLMATKCLKAESMKIYKCLKEGDVEQARYFVSMLVGRDTDCLTDIGITKAAIETVAENTSDGCIAPLVYMVIGGPILGFFYKAVNTLDSMVGYKNEKYLYFGRASAKLDDVMNYLPSRFAAYMMILASHVLGMNAAQAAKIHRRDWSKSTSPNSAQTESVCAGALGIELLGDTYYFGKLYKKPTIGDPVRSVEYEDIRQVNRLLYVTVIITAALTIGIRILIGFL